MEAGDWKALVDATVGVHDGKGVGASFFTSAARRLEDGILSPTSGPLELLSDSFSSLLRLAISKAPGAVVRAISSAGSLDEPLSAAFVLGQLSFAHQVTAGAKGRRSGDALARKLVEPRFAIYVEALRKENLSGKQLADRCGQRVETVSRNLAELRELGLTDFRREGTSAVNFLTPIAQAILVGVAGQSVDTRAMPPSSLAVEQLRKSLKPEMQRMPLIQKRG